MFNRLFLSTNFTLAILLMVSPSAHAGGIATGGGQGIVCRNANHEILSVELLDLWEARVRYHRTIQKSTAPADVQAFQALERLKYSNRSQQRGVYHAGHWSLGADGFRDSLWRLVEELRDIKGAGVIREGSLALTQDSYEDVLPPEAGPCKKEQIVRYGDLSTDPNPILLNDELFQKMDETNKAALFVHEAYYKILREEGEASSIRVRRMVGLAFGGYTFPAFESVLPATFHQCIEEGASFEKAYQAKTRLNLFSYEMFRGTKVLGVQVELMDGLAGTGFAVPTRGGPMITDEDLPIASVKNFEVSLGDPQVAFDHVVELSTVIDDGSIQFYARLKSAPGRRKPSPRVKLVCRVMKQPLDPWEIKIPGVNTAK